MFNATTCMTFVNALCHAHEKSHLVRAACSEPLGYLDTHTVGDEYYLSEDQLSGFAVKANGELVGVFSLVKGRGAQLMRHATYRGATHLDCFDGFLPTFYAQHGFVVVGSIRNWNGDDHPRVVYMALREGDTLPCVSTLQGTLTWQGV